MNKKRDYNDIVFNVYRFLKIVYALVKLVIDLLLLVRKIIKEILRHERIIYLVKLLFRPVTISACGAAIAAPSCVLVNKKVFLSVGGVHSQYYPCLDFVMSFQLNRRFCNYKSDDCNLGGYRVGENESLSVKTMNEFFINRTKIAYNIMSHYRIPKLLQKYLMAFSNRRTYDWVRNYYNMPEYYFDFRQMNLRVHDIRTNIVGYIYIIMLRIINRLNRIHIE